MTSFKCPNPKCNVFDVEYTYDDMSNLPKYCHRCSYFLLRLVMPTPKKFPPPNCFGFTDLTGLIGKPVKLSAECVGFNWSDKKKENKMNNIYYLGADSIASAIRNGNMPGNASDNLDEKIAEAKQAVESGVKDTVIVVKVVAVIRKVSPVVVEKF